MRRQERGERERKRERERERTLNGITFSRSRTEVNGSL